VEVTEPTGPDTLVFTEINGAYAISRSQPENIPENGAIMENLFEDGYLLSLGVRNPENLQKSIPGL